MSAAGGLSEEEWRALYRRLHRPLFNLAYRYLWRAAEAEDVLHDAFLRVWARRARIDAATADRYLWTCVLNLARKRHRWRRLWGDGGGTADALELLPSRADTEGTAVQQQQEIRLRAALLELPEKLRAVVLLTEYAELGYEDVGRVLDIPPGTVASRRHTALSRLRAVLGKEESA